MRAFPSRSRSRKRLEPAVDFWCKVFAEWSREQVALHDDEPLGVIYRVVDIPGPVAEGLTNHQRAWVREQENRLINELSRLSAKHASGQPLTKEEQRLAKAITRGNGKIKGAAERVRTQRGTRERFLRGLEISGRYDRAFREVFRARGLPEDLAYLPHVESSFQIGARSSVGAAGMWQFMPSTARSYMTVTSTVDEPRRRRKGSGGSAGRKRNARDARRVAVSRRRWKGSPKTRLRATSRIPRVAS